jgi:hypothetical protein
MLTHRRPVSAAAGALVLLVSGCASAPRSAAAPQDPAVTRLAQGYGPEVHAAVARIRALTAPYHSLDSAVAHGYPRESARCYIHEHHGAMGWHHVNRAYVDSTVEVDRPEILLYERAGDGAYRLTAVEYIIPYSLWPATSAAPVIFGQPLHRVDEINVWGLHVWIWKENPAGLLADWNPTVSCPAGSRLGLP